MKNTLLFLFILGFYSTSFSQVKGIVVGTNKEKQEPLAFAKVKLLNAKTGVYTNEEGQFELTLPKELPDTMVFTAIGYLPDTVIVDRADRFISFKVVLYSDQLLPEVIVSYRKDTKSISRMKVLHVEEIGLGELRKAACCNLSESFETNASVDVNFTDAVSGAKKIQMMGLDGVYTQIQMENIPYLRGLESSFGLNSMPGTWINSIQITKGTGTVTNGYESMAGLVNLEIRKPEDMEPFYFNAYGNRFGRAEMNMHTGIHLNKKWSTALFAHASGVFAENDNNKDGFQDIPQGTNFAFMNRWKYNGTKMEAQFGVNAYLDQKFGGQMGYKRNPNSGLYGVELDSKHIDAFAKTGFFMKKPYNSIGVVYNVKYQSVDARFGNRVFNGEEKRGYINGIFQSIIGNSNHVYKLGLSGVYSDITQHMDSLKNDRIEIVPGAFAEYTYTGSRLTAVLGARGDLHNLFGFQLSPRLHAKYALTESTDLRATIGKGWRVPNYMIDNISLLATSRTWIAPADIKQEIAWNTGASLVQGFKLFKQQATFTVDYYYTQFENQLIVDRDANTSQIQFKNLSGKSYSHSLQGELSVGLTKLIDLRLAYKYLDVKAEYGGILQQKVMVPTHRGFANIAYKTRNNRWEYDLTLSVFGQARLPVAQLDSVNVTIDNYSKIFPQLSAQITHTYKRWDFYIGGENLTNFIQTNAIIDAQNPFGDYFDATRVWGSVMGANVYIGLRFALAQKKHED